MLDFLFSPLLTLDSSLAIAIFAFIVLFLINIPYKFLMNQDEVKRINERVKEINDRAKQEQKKGNMEGMNKLFKEAMHENSKKMQMSMKPMLASMVIVILLFPWLIGSYGDHAVVLKENKGELNMSGVVYNLQRNGDAIMIKNGITDNCSQPCVKNMDNKEWLISYKGHSCLFLSFFCSPERIEFMRISAFTPLPLPLVGSNLGWFPWYFIIAIPVMLLLRKLMKISV
ncbi:MAG: EMC3/TMCO1 family protein [Candidatus Aenigmatarchaeota archaeon]